jgi:hypothetical protein
MKVLTAALCALTILAVAYLSWSVLLLQPPRANYPTWFTIAAIVATQSTVTVIAIVAAVSRLRVAATIGAVALAALGVSMVRATLTSAHFEGYALILGTMLVVQGIATVATFIGPRSSAPAAPAAF